MAKDGPLNGRARTMSLQVHRKVRMADGTDIVIWAYARGMRPKASWSVSLEPDTVFALRAVFQYLRYRFTYRGAWVVELRRPKSDLPLDERALPARAAALDAFEQARCRLGSLTLEHVGQALRP